MKKQTFAEIDADIARTKKHTWYCELIIAACAGACLALAGVIAHLMLTGPAWTW
jgi:hypothetical protein